MSVARFIADQRTNDQVSHTVTCLLLGVSLAWFYKWVQRGRRPGPHTLTEQRRADVDLVPSPNKSEQTGGATCPASQTRPDK